MRAREGWGFPTVTTPKTTRTPTTTSDYNADPRPGAAPHSSAGCAWTISPATRSRRDRGLPGCQRAVMLMLVCEACSALVPDEDDNGETTESAINYVNAILTDVLDTCEQERLDHDLKAKPPE